MTLQQFVDELKKLRPDTILYWDNFKQVKLENSTIVNHSKLVFDFCSSGRKVSDIIDELTREGNFIRRNKSLLNCFDCDIVQIHMCVARDYDIELSNIIVKDGKFAELSWDYKTSYLVKYPD